MSFKDYEYKRPNIEELKDLLNMWIENQGESLKLYN